MLCGCTTTSTSSGGTSEQPGGLDHLEPLVHQGGRVDRDLAAHPPGRVIQRLLSGDREELLLGHRPERPPRGGQNQPAYLAALTAPEALVDRVVLAVDRQDLHAPGVRLTHHELPRHDQRLLVRQRYTLAVLERPVGGQQPSRPRDRGQNDGSVRMARHLDMAFHPGDKTSPRHGEAALPEEGLQLLRGFFGAAGDNLGLELFDLLGQEGHILTGGQSYDPEHVRETRRDPEGIGADRSRRPQEGNGFHAVPSGSESNILSDPASQRHEHLARPGAPRVLAKCAVPILLDPSTSSRAGLYRATED